MKKFLLFAATVATLSMSAQEYTFEKMWETRVQVDNITNTRQGFGMNGAFYIAEMNFSGGAEKVLKVTEDGKEVTDFAATASGISRDEAGNLILPLTTFPGNWVADGETPQVRVINLTTGESKDYYLPTELDGIGRSDAIGFAKGNMLENGALYLVGSTLGAKVAILAIADGEVDEDNSFAALMSTNIAVGTQSLNHYWMDAEGNDNILHVTRNAAPQTMVFDGDDLECTALALPEKGACCGAHAFAFDGRNFVVYPTLPNYLDGFAIAEIGAEEPIVTVPEVATANPNGSQSNWLNAEVVNESTVLIYQYVPGNETGHATVYRLSKPSTAIADVNASKTATDVKYVNLAGMQSNVPFEGVNMVVTTYSDGTQNTVKIVK